MWENCSRPPCFWCWLLSPLPSGVDMAAVLCKVGFSEAVVRSKMAAGTSTFVLAYAIHKLFAPARISITLVSVPLIVRYFRKTGLFKPRTPSPWPRPTLPQSNNNNNNNHPDCWLKLPCAPLIVCLQLETFFFFFFSQPLMWIQVNFFFF